MRRTARQLRVEISPAVEAAVLETVQTARQTSREPLNALASADELIDELVFELYGLSEGQIATVRRGHCASRRRNCVWA